jgi:NitT/TauT family transport system substrate-binding protein
MRRSTLLLAALGLVALAFLLAYRWQSQRGPNQTLARLEETRNADASPLDPIRVGFIPITDCSQVYVAKHLGLFEAHRLEVALVPMAGGAAILQALSSGDVDVAFSNLASVVFYEKNAGPLVQLAGGTLMNDEYSEAGLVVLESSGIRSLEQLAKSRIAVNAKRNIVDLAVLRALRLRGVRAEDVELAELSFKDMEAALRAGRVSAAALPEPFLSRAVQGGGIRNLGDHFALAFGEMYSTGYFANPEQVRRRQATFAAFDRAVTAATPLANEYGADVVGAIKAETGLAAEELTRAGRPRFVAQLPPIAKSQMREWMIEERFIEQ